MKAVYEDCIVLDRRSSETYHDNSEGDKTQRDTNSFGTEHGIEPPDQDCFLVGGSKVLAGTGSYVVTSVGKHCIMGRITMGLTHFITYITYF
jgi:magnesium-transporting ATPase (P-type)